MARYCGKIGYAETVETAPGVYSEHMTERTHYGDIVKNHRRLENGQSVNDDISLSNSISILADAYANRNFASIRYAKWMGTAWKVTGIDVQPPRLILTLGGIWNGEQATSA